MQISDCWNCSCLTAETIVYPSSQIRVQWSTAYFQWLLKLQWNYSEKTDTVETCSFCSEKVCSADLLKTQKLSLLPMTRHFCNTISFLAIGLILICHPEIPVGCGHLFLLRGNLALTKEHKFDSTGMTHRFVQTLSQSQRTSLGFPSLKSSSNSVLPVA